MSRRGRRYGDWWDGGRGDGGRGDGGRGWYPRSAPKRDAPADGIAVKRIGATWWGRQWVEALARMAPWYLSRLERGRTYARTGRVSGLEVRGGNVRARVTGSSVYRVEMNVAPLPAKAWDAAIRAMAAEAVYSAKLLAGEMPERIGDAFRSSGTSLFPETPADLAAKCSCPDSANPCKHIAAVHYVLGESFDSDPFVLFELRGRTRDAVLAAIREARGSGEPPTARAADADPRPPKRSRAARSPAGGPRDVSAARGAAPPGASADDGTIPVPAVPPGDWDRLRGDVAGVSFRFAGAEPPGAILRALGSPAPWEIAESPEDLLGPAYAAAALFALRCAATADDGGPPGPA